MWSTDPLISNPYYLNWHFTCIDMKTETEGVSSFWLFCLVSSCFYTAPPLHSVPSTVIVCPTLCLVNLSLLLYLGLFAAGSSHPYVLLWWCVLCSQCLFFCPRLFAWILCFYMYPFGLFRFLDFFYDGDLHLP